MDDRTASKSAAVAFYSLFAIAPIGLIVIGIVGFFFGAQAARGDIVAQLSLWVGKDSAEALQVMISSARHGPRNWWFTAIAAATLLFGASKLFIELKESLDEIWHAPPAPMPWWQVILDYAIAIALIIFFGFLMLSSLTISALLGALQQHLNFDLISQIRLFEFLGTTVSFLLIMCLFAAIYKLLPNKRLRWRDVWIGALMTAGLFVLGRYFIGIYLAKSQIASSFGAAGSLIAVLIWIYYSALAFFFGAEFTKIYVQEYGSRSDHL